MNTYRKDCFYFSEVIDFGGHIPFCCSTAKLEDCPCRDCKNYISKSDAYQVVRKHQNGEIVAVRHGEWERVDSITEDGYIWSKWVCSNCGYIRTCGWEYTKKGSKPTALLCEHCGARMDGKEQRNGQD